MPCQKITFAPIGEVTYDGSLAAPWGRCRRPRSRGAAVPVVESPFPNKRAPSQAHCCLSRAIAKRLTLRRARGASKPMNLPQEPQFDATALLATIIDSTDDATICADPDGTIRSCRGRRAALWLRARGSYRSQHLAGSSCRSTAGDGGSAHARRRWGDHRLSANATHLRCTTHARPTG